MSATTPRSVLYAPGDRADLSRKAIQGDADAVILDLEDAVAEPRKQYALNTVLGILAECPPERDVWVRIALDERAGDQAFALAHHPHVGISVAKVERPSQLDPIAEAARAARGADAELRLEALIESGAALLNLSEIAAREDVVRLQLGEADLATDLGVPERAALPMLPARMQLITVSSARGLLRPAAPVSPDFTDLAKFRAETRELKSMGFFGRYCIHPAQVRIANEVFLPSAKELSWASAVLAAYAERSNEGVGAFSHEGQLVDLAIVRRAEHIASLSRRVVPSRQEVAQ